MDQPTRRDAVKLAAGVAALGVAAAPAAAAPDPDGDPAHARGSAKLLAALEDAHKEKKLTVNMEELRALVTGLEKSKVTFHWWTHGIPAIDLIVGRGEVSPKEIGNVLKNIHEVHTFKQIRCQGDVFPFGIPANLRYLVDLKIQNHPVMEH